MKSVTVSAIPTATYSVYSSYSNNGAVAKRNDINGNELRAKVTLSDSYIQQNLIQSATLTYGSSTANLTIGQEWKSAVSLAAHNTSIKVVLKNGYTLTSSSYTTHVTGIPFTMTTSSNADGWTENRNVSWNTNGGVRLGYNQVGGEASITKSFHIPANITVKVTANGTVCGTGSKVGFIDARVENTATVIVGSTTVVNTTKDGDGDASWSCSNASASMSSSSNTVKVNSSYNLQNAKVVVKALTIQY